MAVFTTVEDAEAEPFIRRFGLGRLRALTPIADGVENTNYRLDTDEGRFVLTLFEGRTDEAGLPFCLDLTRHAADRGLPCARALRDHEGRDLGRLNGRPAAILDWLPGAQRADPSLAEHRAAGALLARLHLAAADYPGRRHDPVGPAARRALFERCEARAVGADRALLARMAPWAAEGAPDPTAGLPRGAIHADYFPDNLLFTDGAVSGLIDFYFACVDALAYDLAIALSAWGFDAKGTPLPAALNAFQSGYESVRPLTAAERAALPALGALAAVRFSLTRLHDRLFHDPDALVTPKEPAPFLRRLDWWTGPALAA
jgi:homoserine kinase type II